MKNIRLFVGVLPAVLIAVACGGSSTSTPEGDSGTSSGSSGGGSGGSSSGGSGGGTDSGVRDAAVANDGAAAMACNCTAPQVCCVGGAGGARTFSCAATNSCPTGSLEVSCTSSQMCSGGGLCCYLPSAATPSTTNVSQCMATCPTGARQTCATNADCPNGGMCMAQTGGVYGLMTCRPPPACMATADCAAGQVCCTAAAGAPNSCQTTCATGTTQVCGLPADCGAGQHCCTAAAAGGSDTCVAGASCPTGTTNLCASATDCAAPLVCCQGGGQSCQAVAACGAGGNRQLCTTDAECPVAFPSCRAAGGGGVTTCRTALAPVDAGTSEAGSGDAAVADAPTGG